MQTATNPKEATMSVFKRKNRRLVILFAVALAAAAIVPVAQAAKLSPTSAQYVVKDRAALDAYASRWVKHTSTMSEQQAKLSPTSSQYLVGNRAALEAYEHRYLPASKPAATSSVRIITENSASQNQISAAQQSQPYGPPDPWAYRFVSPGGQVPPTTVPFTSENSSSQNQVALRNAEATVSTPGSSVFDWGDAGVGAGSAAGLMLLLTAAAAFVIRRNHARRIVL
jgi:acyl-CoA synthetase (AMP-forming)/AMP-acid ligase II